MPTTVNLQNGDTFITDEEPQGLADRFDASRRDGTLLKLDTDKQPVWINPHVLATISHREPYRSASF